MLIVFLSLGEAVLLGLVCVVGVDRRNRKEGEERKQEAEVVAQKSREELARSGGRGFPLHGGQFGDCRVMVCAPLQLWRLGDRFQQNPIYMIIIYSRLKHWSLGAYRLDCNDDLRLAVADLLVRSRLYLFSYHSYHHVNTNNAVVSFLGNKVFCQPHQFSMAINGRRNTYNIQPFRK